MKQEAKMGRARIMIVEDSESTANYLINQMEQLGYHPLPPAGTGEDAVEKIPELKPDLILMVVRHKALIFFRKKRLKKRMEYGKRNSAIRSA